VDNARVGGFPPRSLKFGVPLPQPFRYQGMQSKQKKLMLATVAPTGMQKIVTVIPSPHSIG